MTEHRPWSLGRVLAGTDGSERALEAVRQASRLVASAAGELHVAYVIETDRPHDDDLVGAADEALEAAREVAAAAGVTVDAYVLEGADAALALIEEAHEHEIDLLCVGPDAGLLGGAVRIGRTAATALREARCSVLVARHAGEVFPLRLLCAVDGSDASAETAMAAAAIAEMSNAELRLLHVVPVFRGANSEWTLDPDEDGPPELSASTAVVASRGVTAVREMAMGRPERAIVAVAEREQVDVVVVGHRRDVGVGRALLGSVSEYVALHAPCSVLVVRSDDVS